MPQSPDPTALRARLERFERPGVPKYLAMRDAIAHAVASGEWPARTRLPTESELAATLPLSLGTIQRALRSLADEGVITRRQGRGTFVAPRHVGRMHAPLHCRFVNDSGDGYLPVFPQVTARYEEPREGNWSRHLRVTKISCIERVLSIAHEFRIFGRFWFDAARLPTLASLPPRRLSGENFKDIIWRETHQSIGRISQFLSLVTLSPSICSAIHARKDARGQLLEISAFVGRDNPIYYQELYIPENSRRLEITLDGRNSELGTDSG